MRLIKHFSVVALLFSTNAMLSLNAATTVKVIDFKEEYSSSVNVSGGLLIGYQVESTPPYSTGDALHFAVPEHINDVHMDISSIDGIYSAQLVIEVEDNKGQWSQVLIPSEHSTELQKYSPEQLVVLAYVETQAKGKKKRKQVFPTSWGRPSENQIFYINTTSPVPTWVSKNGMGEVVKGRCQQVNAEIHTAFNFACVLDEAIEPGKTTPITFKAGRPQTHLVWTPE
ncbi:hypothetical protein CGI93_21370 [Vibrio parahaemolyticus]|uniref:hypothetical protein n=1 Tax=Vibrio parahaemolyticus TaxID=670 RepID=UPI001122F612|nr:hypothetical protein [Vibrio parahaemolyticus]TOG81339.1 hypothetical protein CGI93_21370 [Vibrio parahaemolyticus]HCK0618430.1 hypothetical protein [Vibrio parahaemolyticus]